MNTNEQAPTHASTDQGRSGVVCDGTTRDGAATDAKALEVLVCPLTRTVLEYDAVRQELISRRANLAYPIRSGVPLLTREAARNLDDPIAIVTSGPRL